MCVFLWSSSTFFQYPNFINARRLWWICTYWSEARSWVASYGRVSCSEEPCAMLRSEDKIDMIVTTVTSAIRLFKGNKFSKIEPSSLPPSSSPPLYKIMVASAVLGFPRIGKRHPAYCRCSSWCWPYVFIVCRSQPRSKKGCRSLLGWQDHCWWSHQSRCRRKEG